MKALVLSAPNKLELQEVPTPRPQPGWALVKVMAAAVCATDLELIQGSIGGGIYPLIPGHEWSGVVETVADQAHSHWVGKRVVGSNDVVCHHCPECMAGNLRYCPDFKEIGFLLNGAYAQYLCVPVQNLVELPDSISFIHGALLEPLGVGVGCAEKGGIRPGDTLTVIGAGSIGLNIVAAAKAMGATKIIMAAQTRHRAQFAYAAGAHTFVATGEENLQEVVAKLHPGGSQVVVDATGIESCIVDCLSIGRPGARIVLAGYGRLKSMSIVIDHIHMNNYQLIGAGRNWNVLSRSLALLQDGLVSVEPYATHILPMQDYQQAFALAHTRPQGFVKAILDFTL